MNKFSTRSILFFLVIIVTSINLLLFKDFWGYGFSITEDWTWLSYFSTLKGNLFSKFLDIGKTFNLYQGTMIIYVGLIDYFFPSNYLMIPVISFIGKIVATILLFPAIFALTRNRLLSFLGSVFFAVSYAAAGSFITFTNSMEYWGIAFLSLFVIYYNKLVRSNKFDYLNFIFTNLLLFLALQFTFIRLLGLIIVLIMVEIWLVFYKKFSLKRSIARTLVFVSIFCYFISQGYDGGSASAGGSIMFQNIIKYISVGNWFVFLHPLAGLSQTLIPAHYINFLQPGGAVFEISYLTYATERVVPIVLSVIFVLSIVLPVKKMRFFFILVILNSFLLLLIYFFGSSFVKDSRFYLFPQAAIGTLILAVSFALGIEWFLKRSNSLLLIAFFSSLLSFYFIFVTWIVNLGKNSLLIFDPIGKYLPVPQIGMSLFLASLFTMLLKRKYNWQFQKKLLNAFNYVIFFILTSFILFSSYTEIQYFKIRKSEGVDLTLQKELQVSFYDTNIKNKGDRIIYYVESPDANIRDREQGLLMDTINSWLYLWWSYGGRKDRLGCIMSLTRPWDQKAAIVKEEDGVFFRSSGRCPVKAGDKSAKLTYNGQIMTMSLDNLFAFTLINGQIIDITEKIKKDLQRTE